ncbi:MAG: helix-turn-helix transcriptional regulator [Deltaproteobacteria bacterium]|nr:helix-turn-helix transcriptional regulator [Deltaproteobacteria bacterium]
MGFKEIGKKIQKAREEKGMTQVGLSKALGITQAALSNYELGKRRLYLHQIEQIANMLGKSLDFFITEQQVSSSVHNDKTDYIRETILARIPHLSNDDLSALAQYLDFLEWRRDHDSE